MNNNEYTGSEMPNLCLYIPKFFSALPKPLAYGLLIKYIILRIINLYTFFNSLFVLLFNYVILI